MIFTTRNPIEAINFIDKLPISEEDKAEIKAYFPAMSALMNELKSNLGSNSRGIEKLFSSKMRSKLNQLEQLVHRFMPDVSNGDKIFIIQSELTRELIQIGEENGVSRETLSKIRDYCNFMSELAKRYSENE